MAGTYVIGATASDPYGRLNNYVRTNVYGTLLVIDDGGAPPPENVPLPDTVLKGFIAPPVQNSGSSSVSNQTVVQSQEQSYNEWDDEDGHYWRLDPELRALLQYDL
jgi:hypothetical protein